MAKTMKDFADRVSFIMQDQAAALTPDAREAFIQQAILQRYSKDRPRSIVSDAVSDGTSDLALPAAEGAVFEIEFSRLTAVEYPIDEVPASELEEDRWKLYQKPAGWKVRFLDSVIPNGESVRYAWTARHKADGSTVPDADFEAVCDLAASFCFASLASKFAQVGDPSIGADTVNYRTKSQEYLTLAKKAEERYAKALGIDAGGAAGDSGTGPAVSVGDLNEELGYGGERLTHGRGRTR